MLSECVLVDVGTFLRVASYLGSSGEMKGSVSSSVWPGKRLSYSGAHPQGGGARGPGIPWDLKNTIFSGFLPLNYVICIFEVCFLKRFAMWEDWGSLQLTFFEDWGSLKPSLRFFINLVRILWLEGLARTEPPLSRLVALAPVLYLPIAQFRVYGRI